MTSIRESIQAEILANSNKPRFCFMGYAPPLCIGDDFDKTPTTQTKTPPVPLRVAYPKRGTGPDACFSPSEPLCVGDDVYEDKWKMEERRRGRSVGVFKPAGKSPPVPIIPYVADPETEPKKHGILGKFFIVPANNGGLFEPKIEYMSSALTNPQTGSQKRSHVNRGPPFKSSGIGSRLFEDYEPRFDVDTSVPLKSEESKPVGISPPAVPFKPPGKANLGSPFPGYNAPASRNSNQIIHPRSSSEQNKAAWRSASVPILSSPFSSIAMNPLNIFRA